MLSVEAGIMIGARHVEILDFNTNTNTNTNTNNNSRSYKARHTTVSARWTVKCQWTKKRNAKPSI